LINLNRVIICKYRLIVSMPLSKNFKRSSVKTRNSSTVKLSDTIPFMNGPQNLGEFDPGALINSVVLGVSNNEIMADGAGAGAVNAIAGKGTVRSGVAVEAGPASAEPMILPGEFKKSKRKRLVAELRSY
jgi:hypothetical protein